MRPLYLLAGIAVGLPILLAVSFTLFYPQASAQPLWHPLPQAQTATATPAACSYSIIQTTGAIVPGTSDIGNHCDDCTTTIALPFSYQLYDQTFVTAIVSSNGNIQFASNSARSANDCLPTLDFNYTIFAHWDDLVTDCFDCGVYTSVTGSSPNRIFNIEWRASHYKGAPLNFEARLYEAGGRFDLVYGDVPEGGIGATVGVQKNQGTGPFTQYSCNTAGSLNSGLQLVFTPDCGGGTPTAATTNTVTSTRTVTPTRTVTRTPTSVTSATAQTGSVTPTACVTNYGYTTATGAIEPGVSDIGNHCDDCVTELSLPFPITFYGQQFGLAYVSSNGNMQFISANPLSFNECLPAPNFEAAIMPHWDDLLTDDNPGCPGGQCGVFTSLRGVAPNRVFNIEWRAVLYSDPFQPVNFAVRFYEGQTGFDFVYGMVSRDGSDATVGVQYNDTRYTQFSCMAGSLVPGLLIQWDLQGCPTPTQTPCPGCTATPTRTVTRTPTQVATATATPCGFERFTGAITLNDPTQAGRLFRDEVRSTCQTPKTCPGLEDNAARHYDSYTRTNTTNATQCVTVGISTMCQGTQFTFMAAYLDSFNPNNICQNYLADIGASPYPHGYMSFNLPPGRSAVIVVSEVTTNQGCPQYTLTITGLGACGTPTPTPTGTPPTATRTPSATPTPCGYDFTTATATIVPGTTDIGNHCDDCVSSVALPFPFTLYSEQYSTAQVSSNGNIQFVTGSGNNLNSCLPAPSLSASLLPNWTDLVTDCASCGIFTSVSGTAPNRIFNIEWRAGYFKGGGNANFEARLYEGTGVFDFVYGQMDDPGTNSTVGVQNVGATTFTQYSCNAGGLNPGLLVRGRPQVCGTATSTRTVATTNTPTVFSTSTPSATRTTTCCNPVGTVSTTCTQPDTYFYNLALSVSPPNCSIPLRGPVDVYFQVSSSPDPGSTWSTLAHRYHGEVVIPPGGGQVHVQGSFYEPNIPPPNSWYRIRWTMRYLNCLGENGMEGYSSPVPLCPGPTPTLPPGATATSIPTHISSSTPTAMSTRASTPAPSATPCALSFTDVPQGHTFHEAVRCLSCRGIVSGYVDRTFKPDNLVTRGQLSKIVSNAAGFTEDPNPQIFQDVSPTNPFYEWINRLARRGHMGGYECGGPGEPCVNNRPYFRPYNNATRAQTSKIVANAANINDPVSGQTFQDVPPAHPFYEWIERLARRDVMSGYECGGPGEPCIPPANRAYFRPYNNVTRGQSAKIVANTFYPNCSTP